MIRLSQEKRSIFEKSLDANKKAKGNQNTVPVHSNAQIDTNWFNDDEMNVLFNHYFGNRDDIRLVVGINADQLNGETIAENLEAIQLDQVLRGSLTGETQDTIIVPVNLGNNISQEEQGHHWAALYIRFSSENRLKPFIGYYDPLGKPMPSNLKDRLCCVYKEIDPNSDIFSCPEKMQSDGYNCGPWVIFILNHLIDPKTRDFLPSLGFDIQQAKIQYRGILNNT